VFIHGRDPTSIFTRVAMCEGMILHGSNRARRFLCGTRISHSRSIGHYRQHAFTHARGTWVADPGPSQGPTAVLLSFVLARREPPMALDFLRHTAIGQHVPTEALVDTIRRVVRSRLEDQLRECCRRSDAVSLAIDG
jgi:hypothetical protein